MQIEKQADGNGADLESLSAVTAILSEGEYPGLNDSSNADALVARHGEFIRHVRGWRWLAYDGTRWVRDAEGQVIERAAETLRAMGAAAFDLADSGERATITKHVSRSLNMHNLRDMVDRASSMITAEIDDFGRDPWLFNCPNGTLDLRTGELRPHRAADYITHVAGCNFNPDALDDDWDRFRLWAANDQQDMAEYIQRGIGYSLTGQIGERGLFFCYGAEGGNGKTTLLEAVLVVMGTYGTTVDPQTILSKDGNGGGIPNDLAALAGKRYVISSEPESGQTFRMGRIKRLTGGDTIQARFMHQEFFTFHPVLKLWLVANNKPTMTEKTNAAWDRVNMVPFDNHKPKNEQDQDLPRKLQDAAQAILAWAVRGCLAWQYMGGLTEPERMREAKTDYRADQDSFQAFLDDCCEAHEGSTTPLKELLGRHEDWRNEGNQDAASMTQKTIRPQLEGHGIKVKREGGGRVAVGLRIAPPPTDPTPTPTPDKPWAEQREQLLRKLEAQGVTPPASSTPMTIDGLSTD